MANSNGWGDGAANNSIGWGQGANNAIAWGDSHAKSWAGATDIVGIDSDAQAFIIAAAITDPVQINAINTLVEGMKTDGIWTKMKAIYPFVGGTATTHKYNLKDPRDLDAAFRLVFNGGWTHSSTGATPNGTNGYADTKFMPSVNNIANSSHMSYYSRTLSTALALDMGCYSTGYTNPNQLGLNFNGISSYFNPNSTSDTQVQFASNSQGLFLASRTSATTIFGQRNATQVTGTANENRNAFNIYLGAINGFGTAAFFSTKQTAFSTIGDGLTTTEAANLYTRVQAFQTALSRQV